MLEEHEKLLVLCGSDATGWMRFVVHPKLRLSLSDARDMTFREATSLHIALDAIEKAGERAIEDARMNADNARRGGF